MLYHYSILSIIALMGSQQIHVHTTLPTWRVSDLTIITYLFDSLSLLGAIATICVYLYLYFFQHEISQKCTLRFVFICMVSVIIETIMDMLTMSGVSSYGFCATAMTIFLFFNTIAAMALCCIGLDLVAVFVFHLHRANKATLYYLILCVTVAIISIAVPVAHLAKSYDSEYKNNRNPNCWYSEETPDSMAHVYYHWMWYYSVLMAVSVVSALCSVLAIWQLHRRYKKSRAEMRPTRPNTNASPALSTTEYNKILAKIIVRCAIYSVGNT
ncbi:hypothetical protein BC940DRAFT_343585 [Gongronella butleri]|nr:hypothetical protein BC940DRAFT_343585 [Gongronella butleri]